MAGPSPSESSRFQMKCCRCNRGHSIPRCTGLSSRAGYAPNGMKAKPAGRPSSTRSRQPAVLNWKKKKKAGSASRQPLTWLWRACDGGVMRWVERFRMAMLMLFRRKSETERLNQELDFHLEQQIAENISLGMEPEQARFAALRLFGNPALLREEARTSWSWNWLESAWRDLRYGGRTLMRTPGFSLVAILVMALGIGATTSLFTIVRSVLLKPLPFREPDKLVMLYERFREHPDSYNVVAPADFRDWREQTHGFQDMGAWRWWAGHISTMQNEMPEVVTGAGGSWNFFSVLGVQPAFGRTFTPDEDRFGSNDVVMLSWSLFQSRFSGNQSIVGKQVRIDSNPTRLLECCRHGLRILILR